MIVRTLIMDRTGETLLQKDGESWRCFGGEQRHDEEPEETVLRIVRKSLGMELPFFTKLLEQDDEAWFLIALDRWPPLHQGTQLLPLSIALQERLEWSTRYVLEWLHKPVEACVYSPAREAASV